MTSTHDATTAAALAHAVRRWEAEVENARRLSNRENGILGVIAMLLGVGLFREPRVQVLEPEFLAWTARALLAFSILLVLTSLGLVLWMAGSPVRPAADAAKPQPFASGGLSWRGSWRLMSSVVIDEREANMIANEAMTQAAVDLLRRNVRRKRILDTSQRFLFVAAACVGLAMVCYLFLTPLAAS